MKNTKKKIKTVSLLGRIAKLEKEVEDLKSRHPIVINIPPNTTPGSGGWQPYYPITVGKNICPYAGGPGTITGGIIVANNGKTRNI